MRSLTVNYQQIEALVGSRIFRLIRYVFSGGVAAASNILVLYLLVEFLEVYYLSASVIAFVCSIAVSFMLHKFLTFHDGERAGVHWQFARYLVVILSNLALNTALVYALVEVGGVWYLL
ncbi:MAG: GtrA family protein, partial [Patescibacteria group bacterium]